MSQASPHSVVAHYEGAFDDDAISDWATDLRSQLEADTVSLGLVYMAPRFFEHAKVILEILRVNARVPLLAGCSSQGLIFNEREIEDDAGIVLALYDLPGAELCAMQFEQGDLEDAEDAGYWHDKANGLDVNGWLVFADPFHLDAEKWLRQWNEAWANKPILGGLASAGPGATGTQVYLNGEVLEEGAVAIGVGGAVDLRGVTSQGCTPIGQTWTITESDHNIIHTIGNRNAYEVLVETFDGLPAEEKEKAKGNMFVGLVTNEYREDFGRGDFLIRNLLGADDQAGAIAVGAFPRAGQTMQFQRRDAQAAGEDLAALLNTVKADLADAPVLGGVLCCCNGRGRHLFGAPDHDASMVQSELGPLGLAGFFCNGEIGPVGGRNFLHGYTASLALFVGRK